MSNFLKGALGKMVIVPFFEIGKKKVEIPFPGYSVMYNPEKLSVTHGNDFDQNATTSTGVTDAKFLGRRAKTLSLELFFDGTGVSASNKKSIIPSFNKLLPADVDIQVQAFLKMAITPKGSFHRPSFLMFVWGTFFFPGVVNTATVNYTLFDSGGRPLRARVNLSITEHFKNEKLKKVLGFLSPDLTQSRIVKAGDTLVNLAHEMYHDETLFMELARVNNLRNYRKLTPGQTLIFPPIEKLKK
jgi:hypothetical protein